MPCIRHGAGLLFLPRCNTARYKRLQRVLPCQCNYTAHAAKRHTGFYRGFSCDCTRSTAYNTRQTQADIIPPATHRSAYTRPDALNQYQILPPRRDAVQASTAAYYNKVYKRVQGCALLWIHARRCSISQTMPYKRVSMLLTPGGLQSGTLHPAGQSSGRGCSGRCGTIGGCRRISFRAFAR